MAYLSQVKVGSDIYDLKAKADINGLQIDTGYLKLSGGTMTGDIKFTGVPTLHWNDASYQQRIKVTDDSTADTAVFSFQQSEDAGANWKELFTIRDNGTVVTGGSLKIGIKDDNYGLMPNTHNWNSIGTSGLYWYRSYITNYYGTNSHITNYDSNGNIGTASTASAAATLGKFNFYNTCAAGGTQTKTTISANASAASNITINLPSTGGTLALVGDNSHTHNYLPLSGGTITGKLILDGQGTYYEHEFKRGGSYTGVSKIYAGTDNVFYLDVYNGIDGAAHGILSMNGINWYPKTNNGLNLGTSTYKFNNIYATNFYGTFNGNATSATKATQDANGNDIRTRYLPMIYTNLDFASTNPAYGAYSLRGTNPVTNTTEYGSVLSLPGDAASSTHSYYGAQMIISSASGQAQPCHVYVRRLTSTPAWSNWITLLDSNNYTSYGDNRYLKLSGGTITGRLTIAHATNATMTAASTNPGITFSESGSQPVHLIYTDYDNYRAPAGLKIIGGTSATPAWLEVEGQVYASTFNGALNGKATSAGTADALGTNAGSAYVPVYFSGGKPVQVSAPSIITNLASTAGASPYAASPRPGVTGTLPIGNGGTGKASLTANRILIGNSTSGIIDNSCTWQTVKLNMGASPITEGWRRVCKISALTNYMQGIIFITGDYSSNQPTAATVGISSTHTTIKPILLSCYSAGNTKKIRFINVSGNTYWMDVYVGTFNDKSDGTHINYNNITFQFFGNINISEIQSSTAINADTGGTEVVFRTMVDQPTITIKDSSNTNAGSAASFTHANMVLNLPATIKATLDGNAGTASKLATARTISLTGSVTGSGSFDGSGNLSIATTVGKLNYQAQLTTQDAIDNFLEGNIFKVATFKTTNANNVGMASNDGMILSIPWGSTTYGAQMAFDDNIDGVLKFRAKATNWGGWKTVLHDGNYNSYAPTKTGTGASGTWGINITGSSASCAGNAATATALTSNAGSATLPIYFSGGKPVACTASSVFSGLSWTGGTTAGPTLSITVAGQNRTATIPSASASASGIITTGTQTFAGAKTFNNTITCSGSITVNKQDSSHEGGEVILNPATTSFKEVHLDSYDNTFRIHDNINVRLTLNILNGELSCAKVYGAVWNDYAEFRHSVTEYKKGICVVESSSGLTASMKRLQPGGAIVSDTFGFAIGETDEAKCPIAVTGRVLAYPDKDRNKFKPGDAVCTGKNGTVSRMNRLECILFPDRIIGIVSEIPDYETWGTGNVEVNGRIWIKIK